MAGCAGVSGLVLVVASGAVLGALGLVLDLVVDCGGVVGVGAADGAVGEKGAGAGLTPGMAGFAVVGVLAVKSLGADQQAFEG